MFYDDLNKLCKERGTTVTALLKKLGLSTSRGTAWKEGTVPNGKTLSQIAAYFGVSVDYLLGNDTPLESNAEFAPPSGLRKVPLFESVSAGFGAYADSQIREYYDVYVESHFVAKQTIAIRVKGDSMAPKIENGDIILVQRDGEVRNGEIGVVLMEDEAFVKKIEYKADTVTLISLNPDYPPRSFSGNGAEKIKIVGRVYRIIKEC